MTTFITFRTYGTWVPGDYRGAVDKLHRNLGEPLTQADPALDSHVRAAMKSDPVILDQGSRRCVDTTIQEVANHRGWTILALNVLSNHVHIVVSAPDGTRSEKMMNDFKSWSTRRLRERRMAPQSARIWAGHGSTHYLNAPSSVYAACHYVTHSQRSAPTNQSQPDT